MSKAMEHVRYLVDVVGFRAPASEGERWASKYIAGVMEKLGIECQVEPFDSYKTFSYPLMIVWALSVLGGLLCCSHGFLGFLLVTLGAAAFYREAHYRGWVSRLLPHEPSQNVVGRIPAKGEALRRVLVCAHYDTSKTGLYFDPRFVGGFRTLLLLTVVSALGLPVFVLLGGLFWSGLFGLLRELATLWLFLNILVLLHREIYGKNVYGANDNASGTGVMLAIAERLAKEPLQNTEVWVAATGCEEAGLVGMLDLLKRHGQELEDALIVNLDGVGAGELKYITGEGLVKVFPADPELLMFSAEVVRENPELPLAPKEHRDGLGTDASGALINGYRAMTVMGLDEDGVVPNWHWETDVVENLNEKNLGDAETFVDLLLKKIDHEK
jgi:hypothetical protein